jgi:hypothetical protein
MNFVIFPQRGRFQTGQHFYRQFLLLCKRLRLSNARDRIVIGNGQHANLLINRALNQGRWGQQSIGGAGMAVKIVKRETANI